LEGGLEIAVGHFGESVAVVVGGARNWLGVGRMRVSVGDSGGDASHGRALRGLIECGGMVHEAVCR